jgi:Fe-S cluster assembly scaffold protein SufB
MRTKIDETLLREIANIESVPQGAYNIRKNGKLDGRASTANITIETKADKPGIDIYIKDGTKNESVHIPVLLTETGYSETVYNDFFIGVDCDVTIVAGCGIHNPGEGDAEHDGVHTFRVGKNSKVRYIEKHYGEGDGNGKRVMNPVTEAYLAENASIQMDTTQIRGVDSTKRYTKIVAEAGAEAVVNEKLMTHGQQVAESEMDVILKGKDATGRIVSRSVARDRSRQLFYPRMTGEDQCFGHVQCDSILMDDARIQSIPALIADSPEARLIHEAAIGKIAGEQIQKLMTLGLTEAEAEEKILEGFLR